jgi:hypothetical protein
VLQPLCTHERRHAQLSSVIAERRAELTGQPDTGSRLCGLNSCAMPSCVAAASSKPSGEKASDNTGTLPAGRLPMRLKERVFHSVRLPDSA